MPSVIDLSGQRAEVAQGHDWDDAEIDRLFARVCLSLWDEGVSASRIAARLRVHRATVYRWIDQIPEAERRRTRA